MTMTNKYSGGQTGNHLYMNVLSNVRVINNNGTSLTQIQRAENGPWIYCHIEPSKHKIFNQRWFNIDPPLDQH